MRSTILIIAVVILALAYPGTTRAVPAATSPATTQAANAGKPIGDWLGTLDVGVVKLRLVFYVTSKPDGTTTGTLDSIDQGAKGIPLSKVTASEETVRLECQTIGGRFEGKLSDDGDTIDGTWQQGAVHLPLTLKRTRPEELPVARRPQDPKPPYPYKSEDVTYENAKAGVTLAGTLTIPQGDGPFPAVILVCGSGPNNRNEEIFNHRPFLVLADALTRRGIAVLRYDKRGVGQSTGDYAKATLTDFASDARAGIAYLQTRGEIDRHRIGLLGHSEGGMTVPMVAAKSPDVHFVVLLAAPGVPMDQLLAAQQAAVLKTMGIDEATIAKAQESQRKMFDVIRTEKDDSAALKQLTALGKDSLDRYPENLRKALAATGQAQLRMLVTPWFRELLATDPKPALSALRCPVLAINGAKDVQVVPSENLPAIETALKAAGNRDATVRELPGLNHLFQPCTSGSVTEYGTIETTIAPDALNLITDWIVAHSRR
jgi:uncharacterized protein